MQAGKKCLSALDNWNMFSIKRLDINDIAVAGRIGQKFLQAGNVPQTHLQDLLSDGRNMVIAAFAGDAPVGFMVAYRFSGLAGKTLVYLYDIEVEPGYRRQGIGQSLVMALIDICRDQRVDQIWVGSSLSNRAACALWKATGATRVSDQYVEFTYDLRAPD